MQTETKGLTLPCIQCDKELEESAMHEFSGWVACEECVRNHVEKAYRELPPKRRKKAVEIEVRTRHRNAVLWLNQNRQQLEQQATKRVRWNPAT